jgi:WD40 repeat protein
VGIWSVDTSGGGLQLLHTGDIAGGTWSPDGQWIAFYQVGQIIARSVSSESLRVFVNVPGSIRPAWSSDGRTLAFIRNGVVALDLSSGGERLVAVAGSYVQWFPGTRSILIGVAQAEPSSNAFLLQRADVDSLLIRDLFTFRTSDDCGFFVPTPDGTTVLFGRKPFDRRADVWSVTLGTYQLRQLTVDGGDYPAVSPDGHWVAYTRTTPDDGGLWLMRTDGTAKRRLTQP